MLQEHHIFFRRVHMAADLLIAVAAYGMGRIIADHVPSSPVWREPSLLVLAISLFISLGMNTKPYKIRLRSLRFLVWVIVQRWALALVMTLIVGFIHPAWAPDRDSFVLTGILGLAGLVSIRVLVVQSLRWWRRRGRSYKHALIIGTGEQARRALRSIESHPDQGIRVVGFVGEMESTVLWRYRDIPCLGSLADLPVLLKTTHVDYALFCMDERAPTATYDAIRGCAAMGVAALVLNDWFSELEVTRRAIDFLGSPALLLDPVHRPSLAAGFKNLLDRVGAIILTALLSPIMLTVAIAIRISGPGPVLFKQTRLDLNGRPFLMLKFRTMVPNAERLRAALESRNEMSGPVFKLTDDPRVTRLGKWLRRMSLDELPQLINVVKGDMSLVGPRPPLPGEVRQYDPWQRRRLSVKPGITCLWQVGGRNDIDFEEWMRLDLEYIDNWSMKSDAGILLRTIPAVLKRHGAR